MKTVFRRLSIISLTGVMLALLVWGSGPSTGLMSAALAQTPGANLPSARPIVRADVNGASVEGTPGSACWPQVDGSPQCDFVEEPVPTSTIDLGDGATLKFVVDPADPAPAELWATLPNDKNADGEALRTDLTQTNGELTLQNLAPGPHPVQVQAIYAGDVSGNKPFVTYAFLVNIGTSVASAGGTPEATPEATGEAVQPTEAATPEVAATEPVGTEATPEPTIIVIQPTEEPTLETTPEVTQVATLEATQVGTETTGGAVVSPALPTSTGTPEPTTAAPVATTAVPTATEVAAVPTATPTSAAPVLGTPGAVETSVVPDLAIVVGGRNYDPIAVSACVLGQQGEQTCVNRPRNATADRILAAPGDVAQVSFKGPRPSSITITVASADGVTTIDKQNLQPDNLTLYTLPSTGGNYVLSVEIAWPLGKSTYYFRLLIGS